MAIKPKIPQSPEEITTIAEATAETIVAKAIKQLKDENRLLRGIMVGVIIVLFLGFITLIFALWPIYLEAQNRKKIVEDVIKNEENILRNIEQIKEEIKSIKK